jgi:outer membrane lipoprotein-sorting protein
VPSKIKKIARLGILVLPALNGCLLTHHHTVLRVEPTLSQSATVDELVQLVNTQFNAVQTLNASVGIVASAGGSLTGNVTDYPDFNGYILLRKPADMRIIMLLPVLHTTAMDMVSNGTNFKMWVKAKNCALEGSEVEAATADQHAAPAVTLCNSASVSTTMTRWPQIFLDSMLIRGVGPDELVALTSDTQILMSANGKRATEQSDYDLNILRRKGTSNELEILRVIHFNRMTLLPYRQDIYDDQGRLATTTLYDQYKAFGDKQFPTVLTIKRPLEQFEVRMTINKLTVNQKMEDDQFELNIPAGVPVQKMAP